MFATSFPEHAESARVLTKSDEELFALNEFDRVIEVSKQILERNPPVERGYQRTAATLLAHSLFDRQRYVEAEAAYVRANSYLAANDPDKPAIEERIAASIYKQAEAKKTAGDAVGAVDDFLRVGALAPNSKVRANAEFDAAGILILNKQWDRAAQVLEGFRRNYPNHELMPEVTRNLAVAYLETGRSTQAAGEFERIAARAEETPDVRRAALWQAAELYEKSASPSNAARLYASYVQQYPMPLNPAMDARQKLADMAKAQNDYKARAQWNEDIIRADAMAGPARTDRSKYLAAKATLEGVEPQAAMFNAIKLVAPLDKSLKSKRTQMEKVLTAYGRALDYGVAEVTTAATFGMGELYRQLGIDLMASERPNGLDAEAKEQYDVLLEEQAFPFEEKAIELHETNARRTGDGVYDEWVQRSFDVLAKLKPARYAKAEKSEDYVPTLR
jgi:tetratricopeptide (TPR) repeat protein